MSMPTWFKHIPQEEQTRARIRQEYIWGKHGQVGPTLGLGTYHKLLHQRNPGSLHFHHIGTVLQYSVHCCTGNNLGGTSSVLKRKKCRWFLKHLFCLKVADFNMFTISPHIWYHQIMIYTPQSRSSELSSQSLSWSHNHREGMQRWLSHRYSLSVQSRGPCDKEAENIMHELIVFGCELVNIRLRSKVHLVSVPLIEKLQTKRWAISAELS